MDMMMSGGMAMMMVVATVFWLLVLVALGAAVWWLVRRERPAPRDPALDALRERYARGEITRDEFETRRRDLAA
jgi:putative membrane protein